MTAVPEPGGAARPAAPLLVRALRRVGDAWRGLIIGVPTFWLALFFLVPFLIVLKISLAQSIVGRPPYSALLEWGEGAWPAITASLRNYVFLTQDWLYLAGYLNSVKIALISTALCLVCGYPIAYGIARSTPGARNILLLFVILPFWTSFLLRIYAWMGILNKQGILNGFLVWSGILDQPVEMMNTEFAVYLGIVYSYLPFMILPLYVTLEKLDQSLVEAAMDLGSRPWRVFVDVTLPLSLPGIVAGSLLVFIPATGEYVIPALLGNPSSPMIGQVLFAEFYSNRDWPVASAVAVVLLLFLVLPILWFQNRQARGGEV